MIRRRSVPFSLFFSCAILLTCYPELISAAVVTLGSIEIFKTHEWLPTKPTVIFHCKGENKIELPDVKEKHVRYTFKGEESWQPLTELKDLKCKRCGFYEKAALKPDDEFDVWELCASDFTLDGKYNHFKDKEFNVTFLCPECVALIKVPDATQKPKDNMKGLMQWGLIILVSCAVLLVFIIGVVAGCKYWQKRKRQQQQAQFLKLFEDSEDIEDELGIGPLSNTL